MKTCSSAVCTNSHILFVTTPWFQVIFPKWPFFYTFCPWTRTQHTALLFFQNSPIHKYWHAVFKPTLRNMRSHVIFVRSFFFMFPLSFFCSSSWSRTDYVHTDVLCHWQNQWHADVDNVQHMSGKQKKTKAWKMEILGGWLSEWDQTRCSCAWKWDPSLFLEQQDACTNSVFCHMDNPTISQRARLFEYNM